MLKRAKFFAHSSVETNAETDVKKILKTII